MKKQILFIVLTSIVFTITKAGQYVSKAGLQIYKWNDNTVWIPNGVPGINDTVQISAGSTILIDTNYIIKKLDISGILLYDTTSARTLTINGPVTINMSGTLLANGAQFSTNKFITHNLSIDKNFTIDGTLNSKVANIQIQVVMGGNSKSVISGAATILFSYLTMQKSTNNDTLQLQSNITVTNMHSLTGMLDNTSRDLIINGTYNSYLGSSIFKTPVYQGTKMLNYANYGNIKKFSTGNEIPVDGVVDNLSINIGTTDTLQLNTNLTINASLNNYRGLLDFNGHTITMGNNTTVYRTNGFYSASPNYGVNNVTIQYGGTTPITAGPELLSSIYKISLTSTNNLTIPISVTTKTLSLGSGKITTNNNILYVSDTTANAITRVNGYVIGNLARKIGQSANIDYIFPIGTITAYRPLQITFTNIPAESDYLNANFNTTQPDTANLYTLNDAGIQLTSIAKEGYWEVSSDAHYGSNYTLNLTGTGFTGINDFSTLRIIRKNSNQTSWQLEGTHVTGTGTNAIPVAKRSGMIGTDFGDFSIQYTIAGDMNNPLPVLGNTSSIPKDYGISQNYPNPFNPSTIINYQIPTNNFVTLKVYDILGKEVTTLVNGEVKAGTYQVNFDASSLSGGIYFYKLTAGNYSKIKKMMLLK